MIQRHKLSLEVPLADVEVPGGQTKEIFRCNKPNALSVTCKSTAPDLLKDGGRGVYQVVLINALVSGTGDVGGGLGYSSAEDGQGLQQQGSCIRIPTAHICWPEVGIHMGLISLSYLGELVGDTGT